MPGAAGARTSSGPGARAGGVASPVAVSTNLTHPVPCRRASGRPPAARPGRGRRARTPRRRRPGSSAAGTCPASTGPRCAASSRRRRCRPGRPSGLKPTPHGAKVSHRSSGRPVAVSQTMSSPSPETDPTSEPSGENRMSRTGSRCPRSVRTVAPVGGTHQEHRPSRVQRWPVPRRASRVPLAFTSRARIATVTSSRRQICLPVATSYAVSGQSV